MQSFRRALELDPRHALARYNLALALNRADRTAEAIEEMKQALAIDSRAQTHYMLGVDVLAPGRIRRSDERIDGGEQ